MAGGVRFLFSVLRCVVFEDEHLLVVNKPAGWNTHAPSPHAGEGIYEWLRHREPRWANLAIIHRLDKETSGLLLFAKTALANRSLTDQFTHRRVRKQYWLLTDRRVPPTP
jgi:23S rRNA-/tRNA-specific pseudouridylate synthase